jgi:predicted aspartyl protease
MGLIYAEIELINSAELVMAQRSLMDKDEVKRMHVTMLVDTGSYMMTINESIRPYLDLPIIEKRRSVRLADDSVVFYDVAGPIQVKFANRIATCNAFLLPGDCEPLLGAIPLEELDVFIDPKRQELVVNPNHPDGAVLRI